MTVIWNTMYLCTSSAAHSFTCRSLEALSLINPYSNGVTALVSFVASPSGSYLSLSLFPLLPTITSILPGLVTLTLRLFRVRVAIMRFLVSIQGINESARRVVGRTLSQIFPVQVSTDANKKIYKLSQTVWTIFHKQILWLIWCYMSFDENIANYQRLSKLFNDCIKKNNRQNSICTLIWSDSYSNV